eukprot:TRINITY_DN15305_c0_g1_i1.p1 TRINITY_DN15305_c0_g1~~TRINITY_DN15305_c0_g1_i1.p1  ORF type:complete len:265 (-),score=29.68 TRINITY_DN15305_c0_g1_i1:219-1013(-)
MVSPTRKKTRRRNLTGFGMFNFAKESNTMSPRNCNSPQLLQASPLSSRNEDQTSLPTGSRLPVDDSIDENLHERPRQIIKSIHPHKDKPFKDFKILVDLEESKKQLGLGQELEKKVPKMDGTLLERLKDLKLTAVKPLEIKAQRRHSKEESILSPKTKIAKLKQDIYLFLNDPPSSRWARAYWVYMLSVFILHIAAIVCESVPHLVFNPKIILWVGIYTAIHLLIELAFRYLSYDAFGERLSEFLYGKIGTDALSYALRWILNH